MVVKVRNTVLPLPPQIFRHRRAAALHTISNGTQSMEAVGGGPDSVTMSMVGVCVCGEQLVSIFIVL
jgi:hypothetical protein